MLLLLVMRAGVDTLPMMPLVGQIFARRGYAADVELPREVMLDLARRPRLARLPKVVDHGSEQTVRPRRAM